MVWIAWIVVGAVASLLIGPSHSGAAAAPGARLEAAILGMGGAVLSGWLWYWAVGAMAAPAVEWSSMMIAFVGAGLLLALLTRSAR